MAIYSQIILFEPTSSTAWKFQNVWWVNRWLYTSDAFDDPVESDVRDWVTYWAWGSYVWTLAVPSPSNVASGVPTDDTVWTADFAMTDVLTAIGVVNVGVQKASLLIPHSTDI